MNILKIPATLLRGGTSKGLFFETAVLPPPGEARDQCLLKIMGSPDAAGMQLDGMGGGISSTSKVAIIQRSQKAGIDIEYLFGQVSIKNKGIDWQGSCGNLAAAAGLYAVAKGYVKAHEDGSARINIWQANLGHEIHVDIFSNDEKNLITLPGVSGKYPAIAVNFLNPAKPLMPNGRPLHTLHMPNGQSITATLINGANPTIFVKAVDLSLTSNQLPSEINFAKLQPIIESLCRAGAEIMSIPFTSAIRLCWLASAAAYTTSDENFINEEAMDIQARISTEGRVHHALTGTGAINLACAANIPGSIPFEIIYGQNETESRKPFIRIAHPTGVMQVNAAVLFDEDQNNWIAPSSGFIRTARLLMDGVVFL